MYLKNFFGFFVIEHSLLITLNIVLSLRARGQFLTPISYKFVPVFGGWGLGEEVGKLLHQQNFCFLRGFVNMNVP